MTSVALRRQIDRFKRDMESMKPNPIVHYKLMAVPREDASPAAKAAYQVTLDAAQAAGIKVILLIGIKPETQSHDNPNPQTPG